MALVVAGFVPHPPIIVAGIGQPNDLTLVTKTRQAMSRLAVLYREAKPDITIIVSPHSQLRPDFFLINTANNFYGSFAPFGHDEIHQEYAGSPKEGAELYTLVVAKNIPVNLYKEPELDHGILVPLSFLESGSKPAQLMPLSYSFCSIEQHLELGRCLGEYCRTSQQRIALIASGDLSHRLFKGAPAGFSPRGKEFDQEIIELIGQRKYEAIASLDPDFVEDAGECGYRSLCILMGALESELAQPNILSYEGPFGVGYAVIHFPIS
ncbi:MAG: AmmeMemoRadiSam system protein B [Patescibacteria group bacterium]